MDTNTKKSWLSLGLMGPILFVSTAANLFLVLPAFVLADDLPPELSETLKSIPVPHTPTFLTYHGELLEHHLELALQCFACHTEKRTFCVSCHAIAYEEEESGESGEAESEDWERLGLGHQEDIEEDRQIFKQLGIPLSSEQNK